MLVIERNEKLQEKLHQDLEDNMVPTKIIKLFIMILVLLKSKISIKSLTIDIGIIYLLSDIHFSTGKEFFNCVHIYFFSIIILSYYKIRIMKY